MNQIQLHNKSNNYKIVPNNKKTMQFIKQDHHCGDG